MLDGTTSSQHATLTLEYGWLRVFRLADGSLTRDRAAAEQDRRERIARRQADIDGAVAALLRVPVTSSRRPTPARIEYVRDLVDADVLPAIAAGQVKTLAAVDDATWEPLSQLRDLIEPEEVEHYGWSLAFLDGQGHSLDVPGGFDPLSYQLDHPPVTAMLTVLGELADHGWRVASLHLERIPPEQPELANTFTYEIIQAARVGLGRRITQNASQVLRKSSSSNRQH